MLSFNSLKISDQYVIIDIFKSHKYNSLVFLCNNYYFIKENYAIDLSTMNVRCDSIGFPLELIEIRDEKYMGKYIPTIIIIRNFPEDISEIIVTIENTDYTVRIHPIESSFIGKKCLSTIQLNEVLLIEPWIDWHKKLGFECFFIYDNNLDADAYDYLLKKYPNELFVYAADFPFFYDKSKDIRIGQTIQQCHTLWKFSPEFLGLTDLDEYISLASPGDFKLFDPTVSVLSLPNYWFGCSNAAKYKPNNFTEVLVKRELSGNNQVQRKCIVKSMEVDLICIHVTFNYSGTYKNATYDEVYLRHYLILSNRKRKCDCSVYCQVTDVPIKDI